MIDRMNVAGAILSVCVGLGWAVFYRYWLDDPWKSAAVTGLTQVLVCFGGWLFGRAFIALVAAS